VADAGDANKRSTGLRSDLFGPGVVGHADDGSAFRINANFAEPSIADDRTGVHDPVGGDLFPVALGFRVVPAVGADLLDHQGARSQLEIAGVPVLVAVDSELVAAGGAEAQLVVQPVEPGSRDGIDDHRGGGVGERVVGVLAFLYAESQTDLMAAAPNSIVQPGHRGKAGLAAGGDTVAFDVVRAEHHVGERLGDEVVLEAGIVHRIGDEVDQTHVEPRPHAFTEGRDEILGDAQESLVEVSPFHWRDFSAKDEDVFHGYSPFVTGLRSGF